MADKESDEAILTDAAKAEIAAAVQIVASDKGRADLSAIRRHLMPDTPETKPPGDGEPTAPPKKEKEPTGAKKTGLWWGDRVSDE